MTQRGIEQVEKLRDVIQCPHCQYSLRGLAGEKVTCPECGQKINVALLISINWEGAWYKAPFYNMLAVPVAWVCLATIVLAICAFDYSYYRFDLRSMPFFPFLGFFVIWVVLIFAIAKQFGGTEGIVLSVLMHGILFGYLIGLLGSVPVLIRLFSDVINYQVGVQTLINILILIFFIALLYSTRRAERFVGGRCVRRYLRVNSST
ncbi:MAG: hypothetical protein O7G85_10120 [Planctomycetota bacterium]|nr:hypothetical protein [Planctomycetota bacterium]